MAFLRKCFGGRDSTCKKQPSASIEDLCHRFSLSQLRKSTDNFDNSRIIGRGSGGVVYRAHISIDGELRDVALERLHQGVTSNTSKELPPYKNNIIYRCQLHHPNLVSLIGFCDDENEFIIVHEYALNGSLSHQLHNTDGNSPALSWKKRLQISIGVARGLHYLHSGTKRTIIHCDIKPKSILLGENWVPKIKSNWFSLKGSKYSEKDSKPVESKYDVVGTVGFAAPELILLFPNFTDKCDVYSFGAVLLELICGMYPEAIMSKHGEDFRIRDLPKKLNEEGIIDKRLVGEIAAECWELYMDIMMSCLSEDPDERPHMGEVEVQLEHLLQLQEEADSNHDSHAFLIDFM